MPLTSIVVWTDASPIEIINAHESHDIGYWFRARNMDMLVFSKLGELMGVANQEVLRKEFTPLESPGGTGTLFLFDYPVALRKRISLLTQEEIADIVPKWAQISEFGGLATIERLTNFLSSLAEFFNRYTGKTALLMSVR